MVATLAAIYLGFWTPSATAYSLAGWQQPARTIPKSSPDYDPDEEFPTPAQFAKWRLPHVTIYSSFSAVAPKISGDERNVTFTFTMGLRNDSLRQIAEVDVVGAMLSKATHKAVARSKPVVFKQFENLTIPHIGALEPYALTAGSSMTGEFTVPTETWRTDTWLELQVTRVVPVANTSNYHDIGNFIDFVVNQHTADVERAVLKDPSLVHAHDSVGTNPILVAVAYGTPRLCRFLLAHGADIHAKGSRGEDAMLYAVSGGNPKLLDFVYEHGFSVDPKTEIPLKRAANLNTVRAVKWLIAHGAKINRADSAGYTPISVAILFGNMDAFDALLAAKADVHCHTKQGLGLIQVALPNPQFLPKLLAAGISVDDPNPRNKQTSLMTAAWFQSGSIQWLLDHGANVNARDSEGRSVFDYAKMGNTLHTDRFFRELYGDLKRYGWRDK